MVKVKVGILVLVWAGSWPEWSAARSRLRAMWIIKSQQSQRMPKEDATMKKIYQHHNDRDHGDDDRVDESRRIIREGYSRIGSGI
jgi:hypothetical protein